VILETDRRFRWSNAWEGWVETSKGPGNRHSAETAKKVVIVPIHARMNAMTPKACIICGKPTISARGSRCRTHSRSNWERATSSAYRGNWPDLRAQTLREEPACRICRSTDRLEVDHIVPVSAGGQNVRSNTQTLCHRHHVEKTAFEASQAKRRYG
jgi:5-methylcytosine-specific restriction protein A